MPLEVRLSSDPSRMIRDVRWFAKDMEPIVTSITHNIMLYCGVSNKDWLFDQSRTGGNSFYLTDFFNQYHFRYDHTGCIKVYDRWFYGKDKVKPIAVIKTRIQAAKFVKKIVK